MSSFHHLGWERKGGLVAGPFGAHGKARGEPGRRAGRLLAADGRRGERRGERRAGGGSAASGRELSPEVGERSYGEIGAGSAGVGIPYPPLFVGRLSWRRTA
jgi:hypothetical protein